MLAQYITPIVIIVVLYFIIRSHSGDSGDNSSSKTIITVFLIQGMIALVIMVFAQFQINRNLSKFGSRNTYKIVNQQLDIVDDSQRYDNKAIKAPNKNNQIKKTYNKKFFDSKITKKYLQDETFMNILVCAVTFLFLLVVYFRRNIINVINSLFEGKNYLEEQNNENEDDSNDASIDNTDKVD